MRLRGDVSDAEDPGKFGGKSERAGYPLSDPEQPRPPLFLELKVRRYIGASQKFNVW